MGIGDKMKNALKRLLECPQPSFDRFRTETYRKVACDMYNGCRKDGEKELGVEDMFVVWSCKTLQNFKCLVGNVRNDMYCELTLDGDKGEIYVDLYRKEAGRTVPLSAAQGDGCATIGRQNDERSVK